MSGLLLAAVLTPLAGAILLGILPGLVAAGARVVALVTTLITLALVCLVSK